MVLVVSLNLFYIIAIEYHKLMGLGGEMREMYFAAIEVVCYFFRLADAWKFPLLFPDIDRHR